MAKFDETIEAHIRLGVDGRHADQQIRGAVVLPHGTGKTVRVLVFARVQSLMRLRQQEQILLVAKNSFQRFRTKVGSILM